MSISNYFENKLLDSLRNVSAAVAAVYIKLHTGDPGEDCANNAAGETTRKQVTWSGAAASGQLQMSGTLSWTSVASTETYTHWSAWDNVSAGNPLWSGALGSSVAVTAGDNFDLTALTLSLD